MNKETELRELLRRWYVEAAEQSPAFVDRDLVLDTIRVLEKPGTLTRKEEQNDDNG